MFTLIPERSSCLAFFLDGFLIRQAEKGSTRERKRLCWSTESGRGHKAEDTQALHPKAAGLVQYEFAQTSTFRGVPKASLLSSTPH